METGSRLPKELRGMLDDQLHRVQFQLWSHAYLFLLSKWSHTIVKIISSTDRYVIEDGKLIITYFVVKNASLQIKCCIGLCALVSTAFFSEFMLVVEFVVHLVALAYTIYFVHIPFHSPSDPHPPFWRHLPKWTVHSNTCQRRIRTISFTLKYFQHYRPLRPEKGQEWGFPSQCPFRYSPDFTASPKYLLAIDHHVHIWQAWPQLSCGDICHIWMWHKNQTATLAGSTILVEEILTNREL